MKILSNLKANALGALNDSRADGLKTCALGDSNNPNSLTNKRGVLNTLKTKGFTLAEVLITLTIIGVVAALTIPSLLSNVNDKTYDTKRKGFSTRMAQAFSQMDSLNSYEDKTDPAKNSSMNFVIEGLSKVYKITNVCEFENFAACDFPANLGSAFANTKMQTKDFEKNTPTGILDPTITGGIATSAVTFKTKNGESVLLWYNPRCVPEQEVDSENKKVWVKETCAAMIVDIDGAKKGSNIIGNDIFYAIVLYPDTPYFVAVNPSYDGIVGTKLPSYSTSTSTLATPEKYCANLTTWASGFSTNTLTVPTREQAYVMSMFISNISTDFYWTSSVEGSGPDDYGWLVGKQYAKLATRESLSKGLVCLKKESKY